MKSFLVGCTWFVSQLIWAQSSLFYTWNHHISGWFSQLNTLIFCPPCHVTRVSTHPATPLRSRSVSATEDKEVHGQKSGKSSSSAKKRLRLSRWGATAGGMAWVGGAGGLGRAWDAWVPEWCFEGHLFLCVFEFAWYFSLFSSFLYIDSTRARADVKSHQHTRYVTVDAKAPAMDHQSTLSAWPKSWVTVGTQMRLWEARLKDPIRRISQRCVHFLGHDMLWYVMICHDMSWSPIWWWARSNR